MSSDADGKASPARDDGEDGLPAASREASGGSGESGGAGPPSGGGPPDGPSDGPPPDRGLRAAIANPAYRFVFLFLVNLGALAFFYPRLKDRFPAVIDVMAWGTAQIDYAMLRLFTSSVSIDGKVVIFDGFAVKIIEECTGLYEILIFSAAVLAFPTSLAKKALGLVLGGPLLYLFNVLRILLLIVVGRYQPQLFDFTHLYFMQATLILMITSVWLLWIIKIVQREPRAPVPA